MKPSLYQSVSGNWLVQQGASLYRFSTWDAAFRFVEWLTRDMTVMDVRCGCSHTAGQHRLPLDGVTPRDCTRPACGCVAFHKPSPRRPA